MATARWFTYDGEFTGPGADLPYDAPDPLLLDLLATTGHAAYHAFSLRKLRLAYAGPLITVRRSSDNATQDIGFTETGFLDTAALAAFVTTNTGFVTKWWDQSTNARHLTQVTVGFQPKIMVTGTLQMIQDAPAVLFDGVSTNQNLRHTAPGIATLASGGYSIVEVHTDSPGDFTYAESDGSAANGRIQAFGWNGGAPPVISHSVYNNAGTFQTGGPTFTTNAAGEAHSDIVAKAAGAGAAMYRDGISKVTVPSFAPTYPTTATIAALGGWDNAGVGTVTGDYAGKIGEHILLAGQVLAPAIATIEGSHSTYFGI